jgi:5-methylcytosine-specific restriction endonuclease McrA
MAKRTKYDISNIAVRIFLQGAGAKYKTHSNKQIFEILGKKCIYCGEVEDIVIDHLIPINKKDCGLHIAGNLVPSCRECNHLKGGKRWQDFASPEAFGRINNFLKEHEQVVDYEGIREKAETVYKKAGENVIALIDSQLV